MRFIDGNHVHLLLTKLGYAKCLLHALNNTLTHLLDFHGMLCVLFRGVIEDVYVPLRFVEEGDVKSVCGASDGY